LVHPALKGKNAETTSYQYSASTMKTYDRTVIELLELTDWPNQQYQSTEGTHRIHN